MTAGRLGVVALAVVLLAGCGASAGTRMPDPSHLPLVSGGRVVEHARKCDSGSNPFCVIELVVLGPSYRSSAALLRAQSARLVRDGWKSTGADVGEEHAAESPGGKLFVSVATAYADLKAIDLRWINRARPIALALSKSIFDRTPALSIKLAAGPG